MPVVPGESISTVHMDNAATGLPKLSIRVRNMAGIARNDSAILTPTIVAADTAIIAKVFRMMIENSIVTAPAKMQELIVMLRAASTKFQRTPPKTRTIASTGREIPSSSSNWHIPPSSLPITIWKPVSGVVISTPSVRRYTSPLIDVLMMITAITWAAMNSNQTIQAVMALPASPMRETP